MNDNRIIKTYVWHGERCFFVSTIERDCSAAYAPAGLRYNETLVWSYDWEARKQGELLYEEGDSRGSIRKHQGVVEALFTIGRLDPEQA